MLSGAELVAFVATRDLDVAARFYGDVLGFEVVESTPFANVFDAGGTTLRVTRADAPAAAAYTVLGWKVPDIEAAISALRARGVEFERFDRIEQDEHGAWTAPGGSRIAWFSDPDANRLSLQQAP
jgi:catechol 2,3-dioxygenase-like lactoylglutathione lyase family enzyme